MKLIHKEVTAAVVLQWCPQDNRVARGLSARITWLPGATHLEFPCSGLLYSFIITLLQPFSCTLSCLWFLLLTMLETEFLKLAIMLYKVRIQKPWGSSSDSFTSNWWLSNYTIFRAPVQCHLFWHLRNHLLLIP